MNAIIDRINVLYDIQKNLVIRISGLSDYILKEQAYEEYNLLDLEIKQYETDYHNKFIENIISNHKQYYYDQYKFTSDIVKALTRNITEYKTLTHIIQTRRIKLPKNIHDRRTFFYFANALNCLIDVKDLEEYSIMTIGDPNNKPKPLYINIFSRWDDYTIMENILYGIK